MYSVTSSEVQKLDSAWPRLSCTINGSQNYSVVFALALDASIVAVLERVTFDFFLQCPFVPSPACRTKNMLSKVNMTYFSLHYTQCTA